MLFDEKQLVDRFPWYLLFIFTLIGVGCAPSPRQQTSTFDSTTGDPTFSTRVSPSNDLQDYSARFEKGLIQARDHYNTRIGSVKTARRSCGAESKVPFKKGRPIRIRFAIGYEDFAPNNLVSDLLERTMLENFLQLPCSGGFPLCEFQITHRTSFRSILTKNLGETPVTITISTSSISTENDFNEASEEQLKKSDYAVTQFLAAFRTDDVIIYWEHGRTGGGPDFYPPYLDQKSNVNYSIYKKHKMGTHLLRTGLAIREARPKYIGIFGCSTQEIANVLIPSFPKVNFVSSRRSIDAMEMSRGSLGFLVGLLTNNCHVNEINEMASYRSGTPPFVAQGPAYRGSQPSK